jgi:hypothetical protein
MTFTGFLSGRLSWPLPWANAPVDTTADIITAAKISLTNFIFNRASSCNLGAHGREKEMRRTRRLQDRCQNVIAPDGRILREKFSSRNENPHGFELSRTLSCKPEPEQIVSF